MKRTCPVCGAEYETCYSCEKKRSWRTLTDTEEHYFILSVLMDYRGDHDAKKAYKRLRRRGVDLIDTAKYTESVSGLMSELYRLNHGGTALKKNFPDANMYSGESSAQFAHEDENEDAEKR